MSAAEQLCIKHQSMRALLLPSIAVGRAPKELLRCVLLLLHALRHLWCLQ